MNKHSTYLITGGAGFIGTNLAHYLINTGKQVIVIDDLSAGDASRLPKEVVFHQVDIRDTKMLTEHCQGVDVVVHLAAQPRVQYTIDEPTESHDVNVNGTLSVLEAVRAAHVKRLIFASTAATYGDQEVLPLSLSLPVEPKSPYGLHKYIGEEYLKLWHQLYGVESVSLRFFNVYGPYFDPEGAYALVIGRFLKLAANNQPLTITGDGEQTRDFIHVEDICTAIMQAAEENTVGKGEVFNVGSSEQTSINTIAKLIGGPVEYVPARHEPRHTLADITATTEVLQWKPIKNLRDGVTALKKEQGLV